MNSQFSHLVWLGAGTASEPANIVNIAEHVTLIEAREAAYQHLKKKNTQTNVDIKQQLVCVTSDSALFTEYNLAEYSAVNPATGLKTLFPGLRKVGAEQLTSVAITDTIDELSLSGNNNALVIDIPDINLALLQAIQQSKQISLFKNIYIHTALEPLYKGSSTSADLIAFMESCGYDLLQKNDQDPELPWLTFFANPLWATLQKTRDNLAAEQQAKTDLEKELAKSNLALTTLQHTNDTLKKELEKANQDLTAQQQAKEAFRKELEKAKQVSADQLQSKETLNKELEKTKQDLTAQQQAKEAISKELDKTKQDLTAQQETKEVLNKELEKTKQDLATQQQAKETFSKELDKTKHDLTAQQQAKESVEKELEKAKHDLTTQLQAKEALNKKLEENQKSNNEHAKQLIKAQADLEQVSKQATNRADKIVQLEKVNRRLHETSEQLEKRQQVMQQELLKAEAQIDIIKELLLNR